MFTFSEASVPFDARVRADEALPPSGPSQAKACVWDAKAGASSSGKEMAQNTQIRQGDDNEGTAPVE